MKYPFTARTYLFVFVDSASGDDCLLDCREFDTTSGARRWAMGQLASTWNGPKIVCYHWHDDKFHFCFELEV